MSKIIALLILFSTAVAIPASGKDPVPFPELEGWELKISRDVYTPENLWDLINGAAEAYLSYDFIDLHLADYTRSDGITIHTEVYRHGSLDHAYGIYASERNEDYRFIDLGGQAYQDEGILNCFIGPYYLKLYSSDQKTNVQEALRKVGGAVVESLDQDDKLPELLNLFPQEGKIPYSEQYIASNFIGYDFLHSAFTAAYAGGYQLFVIEGQEPDEIQEMLRDYLSFTKQDINPATHKDFVIEDPYNGNIPVLIYDNYLLGILNGAEGRNARIRLEEMESNIRSFQ